MFTYYQLTYNILETSIASQVQSMHDKGIKVIVKEALANGRIFKNKNYPHYYGMYDILNSLSTKYNVGIDAIALRYCQKTIQPFKILSGVNNIPHLSSNLKFDQFDRLSYTLNVGRHYSYPGFNDLYWPTGGNPDLITEKSWQIEGGISIYGLIVKVYKINTSDKILWAPNEQAVWTPENVSSTESSGFEIKYNGKLNIRNNIGVTLTPMVNYNHTINSTEGVNKGNELLYNPKFKFQLRGVFQYKQISLSIDRSYTGRRFQTLDNKDKLDPYNLLSAELNYKWNKDQKYSAEIYLGARNIFDETFELVSFFPQPLRTIYIGVIFSI